MPVPSAALSLRQRSFMSELRPDTRLDAALKLTIVSREGCHLCEVVYRMARHIQLDTPLTVAKVCADGDPRLLAQFGNRVPVVLIDGIERCEGKITEGDLRRAIRRARWRRPISRILSRLGYAPERG